jgi:hypothetical protein
METIQKSVLRLVMCGELGLMMQVRLPLDWPAWLMPRHFTIGNPCWRVMGKMAVSPAGLVSYAPLEPGDPEYESAQKQNALFESNPSAVCEQH